MSDFNPRKRTRFSSLKYTDSDVDLFTLPIELQCHILKFLTIVDMIQFGRCSNICHDLIHSQPQLWMTINFMLFDSPKSQLIVSDRSSSRLVSIDSDDNLHPETFTANINVLSDIFSGAILPNNLEKASRISEDVVLSLLASLKSNVQDTVHSIILDGTDITMQGLHHMSLICPNVRSLSVRYCRKLSVIELETALDDDDPPPAYHSFQFSVSNDPILNVPRSSLTATWKHLKSLNVERIEYNTLRAAYFATKTSFRHVVRLCQQKSITLDQSLCHKCAAQIITHRLLPKCAHCHKRIDACFQCTRQNHCGICGKSMCAECLIDVNSDVNLKHSRFVTVRCSSSRCNADGFDNYFKDTRMCGKCVENRKCQTCSTWNCMVCQAGSVEHRLHRCIFCAKSSCGKCRVKSKYDFACDSCYISEATVRLVCNTVADKSGFEKRKPSSRIVKRKREE